MKWIPAQQSRPFTLSGDSVKTFRLCTYEKMLLLITLTRPPGDDVMRIALSLFVLAVAGCVSTSESSVPSGETAPRCEAIAPATTLTLKEGDSCIFLVPADKRLSRTTIATRKDETYRITVPTKQVWYDAFNRHNAPDGNAGSWLMNRAERWKRVPDSGWFALIAANVNPDHDSSQEYLSQDVSKNSDVVVKRAGQLALYPNDAIVPVLGGFYWNNHGQVWVKIEHCKATCESPFSRTPSEQRR